MLGLVGAFADGASLSSATRPEDLHHAAAKAARKAAQRLRRATQIRSRCTGRAGLSNVPATPPNSSLRGTATRNRSQAYKRAQDVLGAHQDAIVSADLLRQLGTTAGSSTNENGFTYGVLHQRELDAAAKKIAIEDVAAAVLD